MFQNQRMFYKVSIRNKTRLEFIFSYGTNKQANFSEITVLKITKAIQMARKHCTKLLVEKVKYNIQKVYKY